MKPTARGYAGRLALPGTDRIELAAMRGKDNSFVGKVGQRHDAVVGDRGFVAKLVVKRRGRHLHKIVIVFDQIGKRLAIPSRKGSRHVDMAACIGKKVA